MSDSHSEDIHNVKGTAELEQVGVVANLARPVRPKVLAEVLARVLHRRSRQSAAGDAFHVPIPDSPEPAPTDEGEFVCRVLLAEDNPINQVLAVRMLEKLGVRVDVADDGHAAIEMASKADYDLVLMDCQMPVVDGYEATREIRGQQGEGEQHLPIVALTANAMDSDRDSCINAGMNGYFAKPLRIKEIEEAFRVHDLLPEE